MSVCADQGAAIVAPEVVEVVKEVLKIASRSRQAVQVYYCFTRGADEVDEVWFMVEKCR